MEDFNILNYLIGDIFYSDITPRQIFITIFNSWLNKNDFYTENKHHNAVIKLTKNLLQYFQQYIYLTKYLPKVKKFFLEMKWNLF